MSNPSMANLSPKLSSDPPASPSKQPNFAHRQPDFAHNQPSQQSFPHNQPNFPRRQPNAPLNQPKFHHRQQTFPHNQPNFSHHQPTFAPSQPNFHRTPDFPHGQQQHFSPASPHPHFLDQSQFSTPSQPHFPPSSSNSSFPASSYQHYAPFSHQRFFAQASRPAHFNHPHFSNQQQQQQQRSSSQTSSPDSLPIYSNPSSSMPVPLRQAAANRRVTISTSAAEAARQRRDMQTNFTPANDGPSPFFGAREIHNAITQVHETLNVVRNEMVVMQQKVEQSIYALHRETSAMHERNNGSIDRVIRMLNYSERNNLARTVNSTITSQSQLLEPLLTCDGVRPAGFPVDTTALNKLDIHQVTCLCELYSLGLSGGMDQKMQRLRMFIGIERA